MDDLIILASNVIQLKWLESKLQKIFEMSDLKELHYCPEIEVEKKKKSYYHHELKELH